MATWQQRASRLENRQCPSGDSWRWSGRQGHLAVKSKGPFNKEMHEQRGWSSHLSRVYPNKAWPLTKNDLEIYNTLPTS